MILFAYNFLLICLTVLLSPFICMLLLFRRKYRCGFLQKCGMLPWEEIRKNIPAAPIWVHAVSVGEVMAAALLIKEIRKRFPDTPILLSTVTETGYFTAQHNVKNADQIIFFPFDYPFIIRKVLSKIVPRVFITLETEIWPNMLFRLNRLAIPSMIVSGRISQSSFKNYVNFRFFFKRVLSHISYFCMQTRVDAQRIIRMGANPEKVVVTGSIKFDQQVPAITAEEVEKIYRVLGISKNQEIFIAGSTHRGEEQIVISVYKRLLKRFPGLVLILAPRHPERFDEVGELLDENAVSYIRKTNLTSGSGLAGSRVFLLDTIGELSKTYSIGTVVFIGGSLVPVGGHNVLEPAVFSKPVIFGNFMDNFTEIAGILADKQAALQVSGEEEFFHQALLLLEDQALRRRIGDTAFQVVMENSGALQKSMNLLQELFENKKG